jgi:hypothetical protein
VLVHSKTTLIGAYRGFGLASNDMEMGGYDYKHQTAYILRVHRNSSRNLTAGPEKNDNCIDFIQ